ncbi:MAG: hypothetical protein ACI4S0_02040 [Dorea sp.]
MEFSNPKEYRKYITQKVDENPNLRKLFNELMEIGDEENADSLIRDIISKCTLAPQEYIWVLARCRQVGFNKATGNGAANSEEKIIDEYRRDPFKFVEEFLQNADDCHYSDTPELKIMIDSTRSTIDFAYNEDGFNRFDVWSLLSFADSTKADIYSAASSKIDEGVFFNEKTGRKGIGFKAVFALDADNVMVHIRSNGYSFKLDKEYHTTVPVWEDDIKDDGWTHVCVEIKNLHFPAETMNSFDDIYKRFRKLFCVNDHSLVFQNSPLLFMHRIKKIKVEATNSDGSKESFETSLQYAKDPAYEGKVVTSNNILAGVCHNGICREGQLAFMDIRFSEDNKRDKIQCFRYTRMCLVDGYYRNFSVIIPVMTELASYKWKNGSLFRTFPLASHKYDVPMAIDAPFELNSSRERIEYTKSKFNTTVSNMLFSADGIVPQFFHLLRIIPNIRLDLYYPGNKRILFEDTNNRTGLDAYWVKRVNLGAVFYDIPLLRHYNLDKVYISYNDAVAVDKNVYAWPEFDSLIEATLPKEYAQKIIAVEYLDGKNLSSKRKDILRDDTIEALNDYLNRIEEKSGDNSTDFVSFLKEKVYPYIEDKCASIQESNLAKLKIFIIRLKTERGIENRRVSKGAHNWLHSTLTNAISIGSYKVIESSLIPLCTFPRLSEKFFGSTKSMDDVFGKDRIRQNGDNCKSWGQVRDFIEAVLFYGYKLPDISFSCLNSVAVSYELDKEYNPFREAGLLEIIPDQDIISLSSYYSEGISAVVTYLKNAGLKSGNQFLEEKYSTFYLREDTLRLFSSKQDIDYYDCCSNIGKQIEKNKESMKLNVMFSKIIECDRAVTLYILRNKKYIEEASYNRFSTDCYATYRSLEEDSDEVTEILVRSRNKADPKKSKKPERTFHISLSYLIKHSLHANINYYNERKYPICIINDMELETLNQDDIKSFTTLIKSSKISEVENIKFYATSLHKKISDKLGYYLVDWKSNVVYLHNDEKNPWRKSLASYLGSDSYDEKTNILHEELNIQHQLVEDMIHTYLVQYSYDYDQALEAILDEHPALSEKEYIALIAWFRYRSYFKSLGNAAKNSEDDIDIDYKEESWRFVYEFIQNVDDCVFPKGTVPALKVDLDVEQGKITFNYNEVGFNRDDIASLTYFGGSNKRNKFDPMPTENGVFNREKTGRKGRGFKSVFSLPGKDIIVHIQSGNFAFKFAKRLGSIIPIWEDVDNTGIQGTRIIVEGINANDAGDIYEKLYSMFCIGNKANLFSKCPLLHLRRLDSITVSNGKDKFEIGLQIHEGIFSSSIYDATDMDIVSGILNEGKLVTGAWETGKIWISQNGAINDEYEIGRYTSIFKNTSPEIDGINRSHQYETGVISIVTPLIKGDNSVFKRGGLYCTLPLDGNEISIPWAINAPFVTDSGRNAIAGEKNDSNIRIIRAIRDKGITGIMKRLRCIPDISIVSYISGQQDRLFRDTKNGDVLELKKEIRKQPVLKSYSDEQYVSPEDAVVLPDEGIDWYKPELLAEAFKTRDSYTLISDKYKSYADQFKVINMICVDFVTKMNKYIETIRIDGLDVYALLSDCVLPFMDKKIDSIYSVLVRNKTEHELGNLLIMAYSDECGDPCLETANDASIWISNLDGKYGSLGHYRSFENAPVAYLPEYREWLSKRLGLFILERKDAFSRDNLGVNQVRTWSDCGQIIKICLYYDINPQFRIPFLKKCVLEAAIDPERNIFREYQEKYGLDILVEYVIRESDIQDICDDIEIYTGISVSTEQVIDLIVKLGVKTGNDFFKDNGADILRLNEEVIQLLECCDTKEASEEVVEEILSYKNKFEKADLKIEYDELRNCSPFVISVILCCEIMIRKYSSKFAQDYLANLSSFTDENLDEVIIHCAFYAQKVPDHLEIRISLKKIIDMQLGYYVQQIYVKHGRTCNLVIDTTGVAITRYESKEVKTALSWMSNSQNVNDSYSYTYYYGDIACAFHRSDSKKGTYLCDGNIVLLDEESVKNNLLAFVNMEFGKGEDDLLFNAFIDIIMKQNKLQGHWVGTKKAYIKELQEYREETNKWQEQLCPGYKDNLNNNTGDPIKYIIPELLQNINDCIPAQDSEERHLDIKIDTKNGIMNLTYDEKGFDFANVYSITAIGLSSKHDEREGEKGLGFKKVFTLFDKVEVFSGGFAFEIRKSVPTIPYYIDDEERQTKYARQHKTTMIFHLGKSRISEIKRLEKMWRAIMEDKDTEASRTLLFLDNIASYSYDDGEVTLSKSIDQIRAYYYYKELPILATYEKLLRGDLSVPVVGDKVSVKIEAAKSELRKRRKCKVMSKLEFSRYCDSLSITLCIPKKVTEAHKEGGIFSTLPTDDKMHAAIYMNIPLELSTGRNEMMKDSDFNKQIKKLLFLPTSSSVSILGYMMETMATEFSDVDIYQYVKNTISEFLTFIAIEPENRKDIISEMAKLKIFHCMNSNELISLNDGYALPGILYKYRLFVQTPIQDIETWCNDKKKLTGKKLLSVGTNRKQVDARVKDIKNIATELKCKLENYPVLNLDEVIQYFSSEYNRLEGCFMFTTVYDKKNPKDCFTTDELLDFLLRNIEEKKEPYAKINLADQVANLEIFPYAAADGVRFGKLKEENILWFYPGEEVVQGTSSYRIFATNVLPKITFEKFKQIYGSEGRRFIKEYSKQDAFDQLITLMSRQTEYNELWWKSAKSAYKLWDGINPGAKYIDASKNVKTSNLMIFDEGYCEDIYQKMLITQDVFVDVIECKDAAEFWNEAKNGQKEKMIQFLRYLGVPHSFVDRKGEIRKNLLLLFDLLSKTLKKQFPVSKQTNPFLYEQCELVDYLVFSVLKNELSPDDFHDLLRNLDYSYGLAVRNVLGEYMPVGVDLFYGKLLSSEDAALEEELEFSENKEEYKITDDPYECLHVSEQAYDPEVLNDIAIEFKDISKSCTDYVFGHIKVCELKFYKWIWNYTHNIKVCINVCKYFTLYQNRVDSSFALKVLSEITSNNNYVNLSDISFNIPVTANSAFENQDIINRFRGNMSVDKHIRIYLTDVASAYTVSEDDKKLILEMVDSLDRRSINDSSFWNRLFTVSTSLPASDVYGKYLYIYRSKEAYASSADIIMSRTEDVRSYYTAIAHYIASSFEVKVNIPYEAEILQIRKNTQNEFLGFIKKFKQRMEYRQPAVELEDLSGVIAELGDVRTYGEEKTIWNNMISKVESLFDETSTDIVEFVDDTISFMNKAYHGRCQLCGGRTATGEQSSHSFRFRMVKEHESPSYANMLSNMLCLCPTCHGALGHGYGRRDLNPIVKLAKEYAEYYENFDGADMDDESESLIREFAIMDFEDEHIKHPIVCEGIYVNGGDKEGNPQKMVFSWEHFIRIAFLYSNYLEEKLAGLEYEEPDKFVEDDEESYALRATGYHHNSSHEYQPWHGTEWVTGHWRCRNGSWEYVHGHWRTR